MRQQGNDREKQVKAGLTKLSNLVGEEVSMLF